MWPGSLLIGPALLNVWQDRQRLVYRFMLAWAIPCWLMFELVPTKLPHYVLPALPALMLLAGAKISEGLQPIKLWGRVFFALIWGLVGLGLATAVMVLPQKLGFGLDLSLLPMAGAIVLACVLMAALMLQGDGQQAVLVGALVALVTWPPLVLRLAPELDQLWLSRNMAAVVERLGAKGPVASGGYGEPSLVFLLGTGTKLTDGMGAADFLAEHRGNLVIIADAEQERFQMKAQSWGLHPVAMGEVQGLNYSRGKPTILTVYAEQNP